MERCYINCMELAKQTGIHSIAFPPISTGKSCFSKDRAMNIAVRTLLAWVEKTWIIPWIFSFVVWIAGYTSTLRDIYKHTGRKGL